MLVLSRKVGQRIYVGDDIVVTVVAVDGGNVRLGIEAPQSVRVLREELVFDAPARSCRTAEPDEVVCPV